VIQDAHNGPSFSAADRLSGAGKRLCSITTRTCFPKTRLRGFRRCPSGRLSLVTAQSPGFTPGWRTCAYKTASGRREWPNRDPYRENGSSLLRFRRIMKHSPKSLKLAELGKRNLYSFVRNSSISRVDLFGLDERHLNQNAPDDDCGCKDALFDCLGSIGEATGDGGTGIDDPPELTSEKSNLLWLLLGGGWCGLNYTRCVNDCQRSHTPQCPDNFPGNVPIGGLTFFDETTFFLNF
jgi:hypothetical protein